jgi:hypothetical protein
VSGFCKTETIYVSHVNLHVDGESSVGVGKKTPEDDVISLIEKGRTVKKLDGFTTTGYGDKAHWSRYTI